MKKIELKIGRNIYQISTEDTFMDNGNCVQLISQSKEKVELDGRCNPVLSKRAVKEIGAFERRQLQHRYGSLVQLFGLKID